MMFEVFHILAHSVGVKFDLTPRTTGNPFFIVTVLRIKKQPVAVKVIISKETTQVKIIPRTAAWGEVIKIYSYDVHIIMDTSQA